MLHKAVFIKGFPPLDFFIHEKPETRNKEVARPPPADDPNKKSPPLAEAGFLPQVACQNPEYENSGGYASLNRCVGMGECPKGQSL